MRFANILLFLTAALLGVFLSVAAMFKLPFVIFTTPENGFDGAIDIIKKNGYLGATEFDAIWALKEVAMWGDAVNYVAAVICTIIMILPALVTIYSAEKMLFEKRANRGWKTIILLVVLGALVLAVEPIPGYLRWYIVAITFLMAMYITVYQWPRRKDPLQMPALQRREVPPYDRPAGQL